MQTVSLRFLPRKEERLVNARFVAHKYLTLKNDSVTLENLELVHLGLSHLDDGVVILLGVFHIELVGSLLLVQDCC